MTQPPDEHSPEVERVVEAISEGAPVEWERATEAGLVEPEMLDGLRLIDTVSRLHRSGGARRPERTEPEDAYAGRTWGHLQIRGSLGGGEYGEVYRAYDPGLQIEVALKLWSPTARPHTIEFMLGEARKLAKVRHPNVLLVYGVGVHDGRAGMWTELLEGATLAQLLKQLGPGHWREIAIYGVDLCRALAAVHAVKLVHRDVKPENVMRERGGRIVLMDFGSAGGYASSDSGANGGKAPSPNSGDAQGTPLAMAPEVLNEQGATPASDLFSLGVLMFRLIADRYPIQAKTLDELRAAFARGPLPELRSLRPEVPPEVSEVIARALDRYPAARFSSAVEMERALTAAAKSMLTTVPDDEHPPAPARVPFLSWAATACLTVAVAIGAWWIGLQTPKNPPLPMQFTVQLPPNEHLKMFANVVISPDGSRFVFASFDSTGTSALWVRRFDSLSSSRIPGTEDATYPFWAPDSRQVAFYANGFLKRVGVEGDSVRAISKIEMGRGGTWNAQGTIVFSPSLGGPLLRVLASGGTPVPVTTLDTTNSEWSHRWPCFLPDGEHFLYVTTPETKGMYALYVGSLRSDRRVYVGPIESAAVYSSGMLVYMANQSLEARPFDVHGLRWSGPARPLAAMPGFGGSPAEPHASASRNGMLVYAFEAARDSRLEWIDVASGAERMLTKGPYFDPRISPDGRRIAVERVEGSGRSNIWMVDTETGGADRWTDAPGVNRKPIWSPNGDTLLFCSSRSGRTQVLSCATRGARNERIVYAPPDGSMIWPNDWGQDGTVTFDQYDQGTSYNIYELRRGGPVPVVSTPALEDRSAISPDGRWLAFESTRSTVSRVQVLDRRTQQLYELPTAGGVEPMWARGTGWLYFRTTSNEFCEVLPNPGRAPNQWPIRTLFRTGALEGFDVDAQGKHLLCCVKNDFGRPEEVAILVNLQAAAAKGP